MYGRRTFSGAINFVTKKPTEDFSGYVNATIGQNGNRSVGLGVSAKLNDMLAVRANISGVELQATYILTDSLDINFAFSRIDAFW